MRFLSLVIITFYHLFALVDAQAAVLNSALGSFFSSVLSDGVIISDFAPVATNPALVSSLESWIQEIRISIPTSAPALVTALPTNAQNDVSSIFVEESSIIAANGGASALNAINTPITAATSTITSSISSAAVTISHESGSLAETTVMSINKATSATAEPSIVSGTGTVPTSTAYVDGPWRTTTFFVISGFLAAYLLW